MERRIVKTAWRTAITAQPFLALPKDYLGLCQCYVPRPLHDDADYAAARQAIAPLLGFEDRLNADQEDYLEAVSSFLEAYDEGRVKWPAGTPADTLRFLLEQHDLSAADLSRILGRDRSLGPKLLRGERRLTMGHIRTLARHFNVEPGALL
jgi:HTH-type transcriptional regulator/antitoxin HigA